MNPCPECGAALADGETCRDSFYQMLYWENENMTLGVVHHLMVLSYHLQHPSYYSPEGLEYSKQLLVDFVDREVQPQEARKLSKNQVRSDRRSWKIKASPDSQGKYAHPVRWTMNAGDVVKAGMDAYPKSVRAWAFSILADLRASGNLPSG